MCTVLGGDPVVTGVRRVWKMLYKHQLMTLDVRRIILPSATAKISL